MRLFILLLFLFSIPLLAQSNDLINKVLKELDISLEDCNQNLFVVKKLPYDSLISIMVLPIFTEKIEELDFSINAHILMVNNRTGEIIHQFYEENTWISDAMRINEISIDTAPYLINADKRAFGIRVHYYVGSKPNPYSQDLLSLFIPEAKTLKKILNEYMVYSYSGEWDMFCTGEFIENNKILIVSKEQTNDFYNLIVKDKVIYLNKMEEGEDCVDKETTETITTVLKFDGNQYQETSSKE